GYFFRLRPDSLQLGVGMHHFEDPLLGRYRQAVVDPIRGEALGRAIEQVRAAGPYDLGGEHYKRVPAGLPADHARADLLRHAGLYAGVELLPLPPEVHGPALLDLCAEHWTRMRPLQDWLVELVG